MNSGVDSALAQVPLQIVTASTGHAHDIQVIHGAAIVDFLRRQQARTGKRFVVEAGISPAALTPLLEMTELHAEDGRLEPVEAAVDAFEVVVVLLRASVIGEHTR